jgi:hypothetical protein
MTFDDRNESPTKIDALAAQERVLLTKKPTAGTESTMKQRKKSDAERRKKDLKEAGIIPELQVQIGAQ